MDQLTPEEVQAIYPKIFKDIFGYYDDKQIPRTVLVQRENELIKGFVSGYRINTDTFYLSWGGAYGNFIGSRKFWESGEKTLREMGIRWMTTRVENTNRNWQRVLLKMEWTPNGLYCSAGKVFVEYYKDITVRCLE